MVTEMAPGGSKFPERKKRKRSRKVCTACRQAKAKCDAVEHFPGSCTRCVQNSTQCKIDPTFKRARRRIKPETSTVASGSEESESTDTPNAPFMLGTAGLSVAQATTLFNIFIDCYQPYCPLFLRLLDPLQTYASESFLFWTIVIVSGRTSFFDSAIEALYPRKEYLAAVVEVKKLATQHEVPRSLGAVQGLILLSEWGFPARHNDDGSWMFINMAIQMGYMLGLHRPFSSSEYSPNASSAESLEGRERTTAWIHCQIKSHLLAADLGVPSLVQDDWLTTQASAYGEHRPWLLGVPESTLNLLAIARLVNNCAVLMGNSPHSPTGQIDGVVARPAWDGMNVELRALEGKRFESHVALQLELAKMRLHTFGLQSAVTVEDRAHIAGQLYVSTLRAIVLASQSDPGPWLYWPRTATRGVFLSTIVLMRLVASVDGAAFDLSTSLSAASSAYRLLARTCYWDDEQRQRDAEFVLVASRDAQVRRGEGRLYGSGDHEVKSRMGPSNYLHDCLASAEGIQPKTSQYLGDPIQSGSSVQLQDSLPPAPAGVIQAGLGDWATLYLGHSQSGLEN